MKIKFFSRCFTLTGLLFCAALFFVPSISCKKQRIFTHIDSLPAVPSQVHFFNNFAYSDVLNLTVDGLLRGSVSKEAFSDYFPSINSFDLTEAANVKGFTIGSLSSSTQFSDTAFFQFQPQKSYLVFARFPKYVPGSPTSRIDNAKPRLSILQEDLTHPYAGFAKIRLVRMIPETPSGPGNNVTLNPTPVSMSVTPDQGGGSVKVLRPSAVAALGSISASNYAFTSPGEKKLAVSVTLAINPPSSVIFNFGPANVEDGKTYSFYFTGDPINFVNGENQKVSLFRVEEGKPQTLTAVAFQSLSRPSAADSLVSVRVTDAAFNIPDTVGSPFTGKAGLNVLFNSQSLVSDGGAAGAGLSYGSVYADDAGLHGRLPFPVLAQKNRKVVFKPVTAAIFVRNRGTVQPFFNKVPTTFNFEKGKYYSVFLAPKSQELRSCDLVIKENDVDVVRGKFKLRLANFVFGSALVDLRVGSLTAEPIIRNITFGQVSEYAILDATPVSQTLFLTPSGEARNLIDLSVLAPLAEGPQDSFNLQFKSGNNGTLVLSGAVSPTLVPRNVRPGPVNPNYYFSPNVEYLSDGFLNVNDKIDDAILLKLY